MRKIAYIIIAGILVAVVAFSAFKLRHFRDMWFKEKPMYLSFEAEEEVFEFEWSSDSIGEFLEPHVAMYFRGKIEDLPNRFSFQLDTGAPTSFIHGNVLESLIVYGLEYKITEIAGIRFLEELTINLAANMTTLRMLRIKEKYGAAVDFTEYVTGLNIGTIGSDFITDRVSIIDFKHETVSVYQERPPWLSDQFKFKPFDFAGRRMMPPCKIGKKKRKLFYDSGSSQFDLITTRRRYKRNVDKDMPEMRSDANNAGNAIPFVHRASKRTLSIGGEDLSLRRVSYVDMYAHVQGLITPFTRIGGWLGNKPFLEHAIIFDTKKEEFCVYKSPVPKNLSSGLISRIRSSFVLIAKATKRSYSEL